ncbi:MAG: YrdC/Sua5 family protein, required for threonylcarbamoyladenosine (t(6)A) formation in tRNA [Parcubacteria group bacterium Licking1014_1]|nr:MAG: YrdC/Sua5 family protein, required for threonylcarbamoyladenosine (t(6)A) formation in tRNA [Parcubacteria group bacterium Licking1014_1]
MKAVKISDKKAIDIAAETIQRDCVIICPTDTVYGFLADASNKKAVDKIFKIKKRAKSKPLPVFVRDIKMAKKLAFIDEPAFAKATAGKQEKILKKYWPGKYTFVLKAKKIEARPLSNLIIGKNGTIALRIPKYKFLNDLLKKINKPLAQTSVNISGQPALTKIGDIIEKFARTGLTILIIDGGDLPKSKPSKIIDLTSDYLTRLR